jgi:hypothetical protein
MVTTKLFSGASSKLENNPAVEQHQSPICAFHSILLVSRQAAQRDDMDLAFGVVLGMLHPSIAVLADVEGLFRAGLEEAVLVFHVERDTPFGRAIAQKAPHRRSPAASLVIALDELKHDQ